MFFEVGSATGGLVLGLVGEAFGKRSTFVGGAIFAVIGVVLLAARRPNRVEAVSVAGG
jgi:predicted MFS family arabinose efflux permease